MADQNEYDAVASQFLGARKQATTENVKLNISNALSVNPDEAAAVQKDANKLGVPIDSAMANPAEIRKQSYFESIGFNDVVDSKAASDFYQDQNKANIGSDSVQEMIDLSKAAQTLGTAGRSIGRFAADIPAGIFGIGEGVMKTIADPLDWATGGNAPNRFRVWGNELEQLRKTTTQAGDIIQGDMPKDPGVFERNLYNTGRSFGDMLPGMLATIVTKNPYYALGTAGIVQGGQSTSESLDEGVAPIKALTRGIIDAGWEVIFEKFGVDKLLKDIAVNSGFGKMLIHQIVRELPSELATTLMQQVDEYAITKTKANFNEFMQQLGPAELDTAISTVMQTVLTAGLGHGVNRIKQKIEGVEDAKQSNASFDILTKLNDLISTNKVKERDIESFHTFMQSATEDGDVSHVFIEPKVMVQALEASGMTQEQFATESPVISKQLNESMATNTDLAIPVADFATELAGKSYSQSLIAHLKTDPNGMSQVEAQQYMVEHGNDLKEEVEKILGENTNMQEFNASKDRVKQHILQNLNESTERPAIKNENDSELIATRTAVRAAQLHMTPEALFQKHLLKVSDSSSETTTGDVVLNQKHHVTLDTSILDITDQSTKGLKKAAAAYAKKNFANSVVKNESDGQDIIISNQGIKHGASGTGSKLSALALSALDQIIGKAKYTHSEQDNKNRNTIKEVRFYETTVNLGDEKAKLKIVVRVANDGSRYYDHYEIENPAGQSGKLRFNQDSLQPFTGLLSKEDIASLKRLEPKSNTYSQSGLKQTETPEFKAWAGTDKPVIESDEVNGTSFKGDGPFVMELYHGTTHNFNEFKGGENGNIEGHFGAVNYFTSSSHDVHKNYMGVGPDLTSRIEQKAERLADEIKDHYDNFEDDALAVQAIKEKYGEDVYDEDMLKMARNIADKELNGGNYNVLTVFVKTEKPFVVNDKNSPFMEFIDQEELEKEAIQRVRMA